MNAAVPTAASIDLEGSKAMQERLAASSILHPRPSANCQRTENCRIALSEFAERIMVTYAGATMEVSTTEEIIAAARHPYTRELLESLPSGASASASSGRLPLSPTY